MELADRPRTLHTLTEWVMIHNTGSYNDLTKVLINLNAAEVRDKHAQGVPEAQARRDETECD